MANTIRGVSSTLSVGGNYRGQAILTEPSGFVVGANCTITSQLFPFPRSVVLASLSIGGLATFNLPNGGGIADLSQYASLPTDTATVLQAPGASPGGGLYGFFPGAPGVQLYGNFDPTIGPDVGYSVAGTIIWNLGAAATGNPLIYLITTSGYNAPSWAPSQVIQANMQRSNSANFYIALNGGTTASGQGPTGTGTVTGTDGITWNRIAPSSAGFTTSVQLGIL